MSRNHIEGSQADLFNINNEQQRNPVESQNLGANGQVINQSEVTLID